MSTASYVDPRNGKMYPLDVPRWCSDDRTPLLVTPGAGISRDEIEKRTRSLWRYQAALPVRIDKPITLGEGCTPLVEQAWGDLRPHFKLEWFNPTGSFKDRGSAVMLSFLRQIGINAVLEDSSGNGGSSMAGLGAAGGMGVKILAPASTSPAKIAQVRAYGAQVQLVEGPREESEAEAIRQSGTTFYASHNWQPFFLEGTKSFAYELWEDFGFRAPDNVIMPVGAGSSLLGCAFGFRELLKAGQIAKLPRLFVAQPLNCSPIDASFKAGVDTPVHARRPQDDRGRDRDQESDAPARNYRSGARERRRHRRGDGRRTRRRVTPAGATGAVRRADQRQRRRRAGQARCRRRHQARRDDGCHPDRQRPEGRLDRRRSGGMNSFDEP